MEPSWDDIVTLANQFDAIELGGGMQRAADVADRVRAAWSRERACPDAEARALQICLSFECRTLQHCGIVPQGDDFDFLAAIYRKLEA